MKRFTSTLASPACAVCQQKVYAMEGIKVNGKNLHERCFKCNACQMRLSIGAFREAQGRLFCQRHFKEAGMEKEKTGSGANSPSTPCSPSILHLSTNEVHNLSNNSAHNSPHNSARNSVNNPVHNSANNSPQRVHNSTERTSHPVARSKPATAPETITTTSDKASPKAKSIELNLTARDEEMVLEEAEEKAAILKAEEFQKEKAKEDARMKKFKQLLEKKDVSSKADTEDNEPSVSTSPPQTKKSSPKPAQFAANKPGVSPKSGSSALLPHFSAPALVSKKASDGSGLAGKGLPPLKMSSSNLALASTNSKTILPTMSMSEYLEGIRTVKPMMSIPKPKAHIGATQPGDTELNEIVHGVSSRFCVGYADTIGLRDNMEDAMLVYGNFGDSTSEDLFGIFDGHSGASASEFAAREMHGILADALKKHKENPCEGVGEDEWIKAALTEAYFLCNEAMKEAKVDSGSTAVVSYFKNDNLFVANAGDSRAVICEKGIARRVTTDHKPTLESERQRIFALGGIVDRKNRVQGRLGVTRSLGDFALNPYVSYVPDIFGPINFSKGAESGAPCDLMIMACDGLWDVVSDEKAVKIALSCSTAHEAAKKLKERAYNLRSRDNISVLVIFFPDYTPGSYSVSPSTSSETDTSDTSCIGDDEDEDNSSDSSSDSGSSSGSDGSSSEGSSESGSSGSGEK